MIQVENYLVEGKLFQKLKKITPFVGAPVQLISNNILNFFCLHFHCRKTKSEYIFYKFIRYVSTLWSNLDILYLHGSMRALIISNHKHEFLMEDAIYVYPLNYCKFKIATEIKQFSCK